MEAGKILKGRYEIIKPIGFGGMADVYLARDILLDRQVAVKVLKDQFLKDKSQLAQFEREAKSAARLIHPSIINIFDVCEEDGIHYIVMEYVEGITLKGVRGAERPPGSTSGGQHCGAAGGGAAACS
jgi:serine/threonine-protein kinase